ncbi:lytic transglycosylase domain-containing protein [Geomonas propionica]|uniref:Transglycosylase SLT domain-containing protein n=1 Tax=Geomonas propionica TaxID=2798582 RepID=A0ABS0YWJ8_9BACT|nr:lytic transglycosylase domain-containing protein [Geomonas propionica]MBJ6802112.1 transglycosylase SLT domain-containing protein [Geomonas propionica]
MLKVTLVILALLTPCLALAAPASLLQDSGGKEHRTLQLASADLALSKGLGLTSADFPGNEDLAAADPDDFELKLPETELPDSDIPLTFNSKVEYFTRYFQGPGRGFFAKWLSRSERYIPMMKTVLKKEGLPEDLVYLAMIESGFIPHAVSVAAAVGPWQFMPATGKRYALRIDPWIDERRDPLKATVAAALYLKELYALFNNDWYLAAAGYNAGENKILRAISMYNTRDFWEISKGSYLARETKDYVPKLLAAAIIAKEPAKYGFADVAYLPPIEFDQVSIPSRTDLDVMAKACGIPLQNIRELNPELRRATTPPDYPGYQLKVPKGVGSTCAAEYAKIPESERYVERIRNVQYRAKKRDTLASIARRFNTSQQSIAELNSLGKKKVKLAGRVLTIPVQVASAHAEAHPATADAKLEAKAEVKVETKPATQVAKAEAELKEFHKYYTVKKGDTLTSLAKRFNVTARLLSAWNNLKTRVALKPGKRIIVAKYQEKKGALVKDEG